MIYISQSHLLSRVRSYDKPLPYIHRAYPVNKSYIVFKNVNISCGFFFFSMQFASGPIVYWALVYNGVYNNSCNFDERLPNLTFLETCDFDDSRMEFIWMMVASLAFVNLASLVWTVCTHVFTSDKYQAIFYLIVSDNDIFTIS